MTLDLSWYLSWLRGGYPHGDLAAHQTDLSPKVSVSLLLTSECAAYLLQSLSLLQAYWMGRQMRHHKLKESTALVL